MSSNAFKKLNPHVEIIADRFIERPRQCVAVGHNDEREAQIHRAIIAECAGRGWLALRSSMHGPTTRPPGEPDFIILADRARIFFVEVKTRSGKLSLAQRDFAARASKLGHTIFVVRSLADFLEITK